MSRAPLQQPQRNFLEDAQAVVRCRLQWHQHYRDVDWSEEACQQCEALDQEIERIREVHWSRDLLIEAVRGLEQVNSGVWMLILLIALVSIYSMFK